MITLRRRILEFNSRPVRAPVIGRTAETEIVYDRSRTRRHKACPSFAQRAPSPGRRPGVAKHYSYVCKCHYIESQLPSRPAYIHADRPENPDRPPRPGLRVVDFARGRAGFSSWRFTEEQLHLLLLMRPGSFSRSRLRDREKKREREKKEMTWDRDRAERDVARAGIPGA